MSNASSATDAMETPAGSGAEPCALATWLCRLPSSLSWHPVIVFNSKLSTSRSSSPLLRTELITTSPKLFGLHEREETHRVPEDHPDSCPAFLWQLPFAACIVRLLIVKDSERGAFANELGEASHVLKQGRVNQTQKMFVIIHIHSIQATLQAQVSVVVMQYSHDCS